MIRKIISGISLVAGLVLINSGVSSAHVAVTPTQVNVGTFQTFTTSVPNEKEANATIGIRVVIPAGLQYVSPTVKPGWTIETKKTGEGEAATVTEISWVGGSIPAGQRDDFTFSGQAPAKTATLQWKAYQTYDDGTIVSWDQKPSATDDESITPYSETKVVNDLTDRSTMRTDNNTNSTLPLLLSLGAIVLAAAALMRKRS